MTVKELRRYRAVCAEIDQIKAKLKGNKIHVKDSVQSASKHPYSVHSVSIEGDIYEHSSPTLLAKLQRLLEDKQSIEHFVNSIPDYKIRRALEIYCLEPLNESMDSPSWENVADSMSDGSTGESLRKATTRFIEKI